MMRINSTTNPVQQAISAFNQMSLLASDHINAGNAITTRELANKNVPQPTPLSVAVTRGYRSSDRALYTWLSTPCVVNKASLIKFYTAANTPSSENVFRAT